MSTNSLIGVRRDDGSVVAAYCHFDGGLDSVGKKLKEYYNNRELAIMLISGGDMSSLGIRLFPTKNSGHSFDNPERGVTVYYGRDRGEESPADEYVDVEEYAARSEDFQYIYLFIENDWYLYSKNGWIVF